MISGCWRKRDSSIYSKLVKRIKVDLISGCWEWIGSKNVYGYGVLWYNKWGKRTLVHRVIYSIFIGVIPNGMFVCHKCDNRSCVNPEHLFIGTAKDNTQDCIRKGRFVIHYGEECHNSKLTNEQVLKIRIDPRPHKEISKEYNIDKSIVSRIQTGHRWKHI